MLISIFMVKMNSLFLIFNYNIINIMVSKCTSHCYAISISTVNDHFIMYMHLYISLQKNRTQLVDTGKPKY